MMSDSTFSASGSKHKNKEADKRNSENKLQNSFRKKSYQEQSNEESVIKNTNFKNNKNLYRRGSLEIVKVSHTDERTESLEWLKTKLEKKYTELQKIYGISQNRRLKQEEVLKKYNQIKNEVRVAGLFHHHIIYKTVADNIPKANIKRNHSYINTSNDNAKNNGNKDSRTDSCKNLKSSSITKGSSNPQRNVISSNSYHSQTVKDYLKELKKDEQISRFKETQVHSNVFKYILMKDQEEAVYHKIINDLIKEEFRRTIVSVFETMHKRQENREKSMIWTNEKKKIIMREDMKKKKLIKDYEEQKLKKDQAIREYKAQFRKMYSNIKLGNEKLNYFKNEISNENSAEINIEIDFNMKFNNISQSDFNNLKNKNRKKSSDSEFNILIKEKNNKSFTNGSHLLKDNKEEMIEVESNNCNYQYDDDTISKDNDCKYNSEKFHSDSGINSPNSMSHELNKNCDSSKANSYESIASLEETSSYEITNEIETRNDENNCTLLHTQNEIFGNENNVDTVDKNNLETFNNSLREFQHENTVTCYDQDQDAQDKKDDQDHQDGQDDQNEQDYQDDQDHQADQINQDDQE